MSLNQTPPRLGIDGPGSFEIAGFVPVCARYAAAPRGEHGQLQLPLPRLRAPASDGEHSHRHPPALPQHGPGRVLLTALDEVELSQLYQHVRLDDYPAPAPRTPELRQLVDQDRERGWVLHRSDYSTAIATGIRDHSGTVIAAINLSGPDAVMDTTVAQERFLETLLATSVEVSKELGHSPA